MAGLSASLVCRRGCFGWVEGSRLQGGDEGRELSVSVDPSLVLLSSEESGCPPPHGSGGSDDQPGSGPRRGRYNIATAGPGCRASPQFSSIPTRTPAPHQDVSALR